MAGILDLLSSDDPQMRMGLGLLAAAGPQATPMSFGQRLAGAVGQFQQQRVADEERKQRAAMQAMQMQQAQQAMAQQQWQHQQQLRAQTRQDSMDALPGQFMQQAQPAQMLGSRDVGGPPAQEPGFDMAGYANAMFKYDPKTALALQASMRKDTTPIKLGAGDSLVDPTTYKPLVTNQKEAEQPSSVKEYLYAKVQGYPGTFEAWAREQANLKAPKTTVSVNTGQKGFDNTLKLRGDFRSEPVYKAHQEMQSAYAQIQQSLKQASPAGDLAGATKMMKLLDPGSVVRESELGMAMAASGLLDRVENYAANILRGTKLTPTQRADFQRLSDALFSESVKQYNAKRGEYQGIAERNGLSVPDVLGSPDATPAGRVVNFGDLK